MYADIALIAYLIDRFFGEFRFLRHPIVVMGDYIKWFKRRFYKDSIIRGALLSITLIVIVFIISYAIQSFIVCRGGDTPIYGCSLLTTLLYGIIASTTIASKMLYDSVQEIIFHPKKIRYLVSRDTQNLSHSEINKAAIETYAENLSDGVIAPLFYLVLFGLPGAFVYKAINTLDSMVGYHNDRYERFGKFSARLDDIANYIPARITAVLILILSANGVRSLYKVFQNGKQHHSPNAGYPISAMAYALGLKLGGPTPYFGKLKYKPYFGEGKEEIDSTDIKAALSLQPRLDIAIVLILILWEVM